MNNNNDRIRIGARIREERERLGISQKVFSEIIEIGSNNLSRIELGKFNIGSDTLHKIAKALNLKLDFVKKK